MFISDFLISLQGIKFYIWLIFILVAALLFYVSIKLAKSADVIIEKTRFGGAFIGGALVSAVTSFPELVTATTQAALGNPIAGISDDLGSNAFAVFVILLSALLLYKDLFFLKIKGFSRIMVLISLLSSTFYGIFLFFGKDVVIGTIGVYAIGIIPAIFLIIYIVVIFSQYKYGDSDEILAPNIAYKNISVKRAIIYFIISSFFLIIVSLFLNYTTTAMSDPRVYNINSNTAGGIFLAITTSLPDIVAYAYFVKNKQPIAGFATLIGSSIINNSFIFYGDLAFTKEPIIIAQAGSNTYGIAFLVMFLLALISLVLLFPKIFRKKRYYFIVPIIGIISYFIGWFLIISL